MRFTAGLCSVALLAGSAVAHPGHDITQEMQERRDFLGAVKRTDLSHCAAKLAARHLDAQNKARRSKLAAEIQAKRGLKKRDSATVLAASHNSSSLGYSLNTEESALFSSNSSCVLTPEVTQGPYYVGGEYIRSNVVEEQEGVPIMLDYQVIDVDTCEPIPSIYVEMWHCNATGVYGGIVASGNGAGTDDQSNIDNTWLRGIQKTDAEGVAQFESIFPGHYTGRATHIHIMVHTNATLYVNGTLGSDVTASHVGQAFFDQDLITAVEATAPYTTNSQTLTTNAEDGILTEETATDGVDPLMQYTLLGDSVQDGVLAWLAFGINTTYTSSVTPAAFLYAEGGVANANSGSGMGGGSPPGGSAAPSGSVPTGAAPSGASSATATVAASAAARKRAFRL